MNEIGVNTEYSVVIEVTHVNGAWQEPLKLVKTDVPNGHYELHLVFDGRPYTFDVLVVDGKMVSLAAARLKALTKILTP